MEGNRVRAGFLKESAVMDKQIVADDVDVVELGNKDGFDVEVLYLGVDGLKKAHHALK